MGLFTKKTLVCEKCGKEYQKLFAGGSKICEECSVKSFHREMAVSSYKSYASAIGLTKNGDTLFDEMVAHSSQILEKYRVTNGISRDELQNISDNYKKTSEDVILDSLRRSLHSTAKNTVGAVYTDQFFVPTACAGAVVDVEDIFAVGFTTSLVETKGREEALRCVVFSNDKFAPVFSLTLLGELGTFEVFKSKKGRQAATEWFSSICPNLLFPVMDLKDLKDIVKKDGYNGKITKEDFLKYIKLGKSGTGVFDDSRVLKSDVDSFTRDLLDSYGYISGLDIKNILCMDKTANKLFWQRKYDVLKEQIGEEISQYFNQ